MNSDKISRIFKWKRDDEQAATEENPMRLVRFEDINGRVTFVNADRVNHVSDYGSGTTEISFGDEQATVYVAVEVSAVAATLLKSGKPQSDRDIGLKIASARLSIGAERTA